MNIVDEAGALKPVPDNRLWVIDLTANPPKLIDTVTVGKQPSGLSINRAGNLALIANRADNSISVLRITGKKVKLIDTVAIGEQVAHVVFTPDGKRALAAKFPGHKVALLDVAGEKVTYGKYDMGGRPVAVQRRRHARRQARADAPTTATRAPPTARSTR